jgi:hypothetical protein
VYGEAIAFTFEAQTPTPATGVTLAASPGSPSATGASVTFTATGSGSTTGGEPTPEATYEYRFWVDDGSGWLMVQDYGVAASYTLTAPADGSYSVAVWVRTTSTVEADFYGPGVQHVVGFAPTSATGVTLSASPASPSAAGASVTFTAAGSGSTTGGEPTPGAAYQYRFWIFQNGAWEIAQEYGVGSTYTITSPQAGTYQVAAWVRTTSAVEADYYGSPVTHVVGVGTPTPATGVALVANPTSPSAAGAPVTFTATGTGSTTAGAPTPGSGYDYRFWVNDGSGWVLAQEYGSGSTFTLENAVPGTYLVAAWVRTTNAVEADFYGPAVLHTVGFDTPTPATGLELVASPASPSAPGAAVTFTATGSGSTTSGQPTPANTYQYRFWVNDGTGWLMVQDYGVGPEFTLTSPAPGAYQVAAWVRTTDNVVADYYGAATWHVVQ